MDTVFPAICTHSGCFHVMWINISGIITGLNQVGALCSRFVLHNLVGQCSYSFWVLDWKIQKQNKLTFEWFNLCFPIRGRGEVSTQNETGGRHGSITCQKKKQTWLPPSREHIFTCKSCTIRPENMMLSLSITSTLSSQTSETITNMASSFSSSSCFSLAEAFTEVEDGPPKKLMLP